MAEIAITLTYVLLLEMGRVEEAGQGTESSEAAAVAAGPSCQGIQSTHSTGCLDSAFDAGRQLLVSVTEATADYSFILWQLPILIPSPS